MKIFYHIKDISVRLEHRIYLSLKRKKLKNRSACILASNCNGAFILHDMKCKFNTPTVNLFFYPKDFLKFIENPIYYLDSVPIEVNIPGVTYPVGQLNDISLFFMHFDSFEHAKNKWIERSKRVNLNNMYIIMTDRNGCTYEDLVRFDQLPYKHKVVFTHKKYPEIASSFYIPGSEVGEEVGILSDRKPGFWNRRWLDSFDYISFLNDIE